MSADRWEEHDVTDAPCLLRGHVSELNGIISKQYVLRESSLYLSFFFQNEISEVAEK